MLERYIKHKNITALTNRLQRYNKHWQFVQWK